MDLHIRYLGNHNAGLTKVENAKGLRRLSSAEKYLRCATTEIQKEFCKPHEYSGTCWIDRSEFAPSQQIDARDGRANWNPNHLVYKLIGRGTAFVILRALHEVLTTWSEAKRQVLPDETWHATTSYYENTRSKIRALDPEDSLYNGYIKKGLEFFWKYPFKARRL
jgi:hypothetical protein